MISFLEYLKEYEQQLKEDAVLAAQSGGSSASEVTSPEVAAQSAKAADVIATGDAAPPTTDNSVLGTMSKKKSKDCGFFGKDDFRIPQNILSGEVQRRIELPKPRA